MKSGPKQYRYQNMGIVGGINVFFDSDQTFEEKRALQAYSEVELNTCIGKIVGDLYYNGRLEGTVRRECTCSSCFCKACSKEFLEFFQNGNMVGRVEDFCCSKCSICFICGQYYCCFYKRCNILDKDGNRIFSLQAKFCQASVLFQHCLASICCPWKQFQLFTNDGKIVGRAWQAFLPFKCRMWATLFQPKELVGLELNPQTANNPNHRNLFFLSCIFMARYFTPTGFRS